MEQQQKTRSIPRPLVRTNQWTIFLSVILTWITGFSWWLAIPLLAGLLGLCFGFNPIMRLAKRFLRKHPSAYTPEDWEQQQFNQIIAVVCLALGLIGFLIHSAVLAYIFTIMVALASGIAILGFCIGCFIRYQWIQYRYRRQQRMQAQNR